jgi:hypothetical protein
MRAGAAVKGKEELSDDDFVALFCTLAQGIQDRGKAELGVKTMIDAWNRRPMPLIKRGQTEPHFIRALRQPHGRLARAARRQGGWWRLRGGRRGWETVR